MECPEMVDMENSSKPVTSTLHKKKRKRIVNKGLVPIPPRPPTVGPRMECHVDDLGAKDNHPLDSNKSYFSTKLLHNDYARFKAAGIIFFRTCDSNNIEILLGRKAKKDQSLALLGGKRERHESPITTACRELFEETGGLMDSNIFPIIGEYLSQSISNNMEDSNFELESCSANYRACLVPSVMWIEFGLYVLFFLPVNEISGLAEEIDSTRTRFAAHASSSAWIQSSKAFRELLSLHWINVLDIRRSSDSSSISDPTISCQGQCYPGDGGNHSESCLVSMNDVSNVSTNATSDTAATAAEPAAPIAAPEEHKFSSFAKHVFNSQAFSNWLSSVSTS